MADYDDTNRGVLFRETDKKSDKHPDYSGKINIAGTEYRLAGWLKDGKRGKFLSLAASEPRSDVRTEQRAELDDEIPF